MSEIVYITISEAERDLILNAFGGVRTDSVSEMVEALRELDRLLTQDWGDPADKLTQARFGHDPCAAWAKMRSALASATGGCDE